MKNIHSFSDYKVAVIAVAVMVAVASANAAPMLLGGFDGNQTQNTIAPATVTSSTGVRELVGAKQSAEAVGSVAVRIWTDQTTAKELQWAATAQSTADGQWGVSTFIPAASTANDRWVVTQQNPSWINFEIENTGTEAVALDKFHISANRTSVIAPTVLTLSLQQNGTFANPPVLSPGALVATGTKDVTLNAGTGWFDYEFAFTDMLSDLTLAAGEKATLRIANNAGTARLYLDNIAISGDGVMSVLLSNDEVATNAAPGTLVGTLVGPDGADSFALTNALAGGSDADNDKFQFTDGTNLRTRVWMSQYSNNVAIAAVSNGVGLVTNSFVVYVTEATSFAFRVSAEVSSPPSDGDIVGTMMAGNDANATFSVISGRTDLFTTDANDNLLVTNAASWGAVGTTNYVTLRGASSAGSSDLIIGVEVVSGDAAGSIFLFR